MNKIKDFFYNFFYLLLLLAILSASAYVVYFNLDYLMSLKYTSTKDVVTQEKEEIKEISITIPNGITKEQLAKLLKGYKIIENEKTFIETFDKINKDAKIKAGDFNIMSNDSIEKVINKITE